MKKISTMDIILLVLFIAWVAALDMNNLTIIQEIGLGATLLYGALLVIKVVKK
ncbi:hypothetical protein [Pelosinus propionicus]|uniref:hypothetical protein n=1 Tax=Pelosinus propionicus TaxID=380084 RepID=UPI0015871FAB|nr:hypothetical protein [Pelosinus propionicus]